MQPAPPAPAQNPPSSFAAPLPHDPPAPRPSLSKSLQQLQGEAAFATRTLAQQASAPAPRAETALAPPPLPTATAGDDEPFIDGVTHRRLFVRLPESDPVQLLLERYVPPEQRPQRDLSGDYSGRTLDQLITAHDWRGVARYAYDAVTQSPPELTSHILSHWLLRFHALLRLHLLPALSAELAAVSALLPPTSCLSTSPAPDIPPFHPALPFELHLLQAALPALLPEGSKPAAVEALAALLSAAKGEMWRAKRAGIEADDRAWRERVERTAGVLGGVLGEMKAATAQRALMSSATSPTSALLAALARHHYSTGDLASLAPASAATEESGARRARVLELVARAEWPQAESELRAPVQDDPEDVEAQVNLAVVLLYSAQLDAAISLLTALLAAHPLAAYHTPPLLFNLCTLYELRLDGARAAEEKVRLLVDAARYGAQGIEAGAFKLAL
ncbi:hypothetical protein JCM10449v2_005215 [Rhodotorula kratochvilovae]